jgi:hypothetical protein
MPTDDEVLSWWNQAHDPHAGAVTPEMVSAYTRQVVPPLQRHHVR